MEQGQRLAYLEALGIQQWVPQQPLPRAKASEFLVAVEPEPAEVLVAPQPENNPAVSTQTATAPPSAPTQEQQETHEPLKAAVTQSLPQAERAQTQVTPLAPGEPEPEQAQVESTTDGQPAVEQVRFALHGYKIENTLWLVQLANRDAPGLSNPERKLLESIVHFYHQKAFNLLNCPVVPFLWPVVDNPAYGQQASLAAEAVNGFIQAQQEQQAVADVLLLAPALNNLLTGTIKPLASLQQLLQSSTSKKQLFNALANQAHQIEAATLN